MKRTFSNLSSGSIEVILEALSSVTVLDDGQGKERGREIVWLARLALTDACAHACMQVQLGIRSSESRSCSHHPIPDSHSCDNSITGKACSMVNNL